MKDSSAWVRAITIAILVLVAAPIRATTFISLGVFSTAERANRFAVANEAVVIVEAMADGRERFRVALGPFEERPLAQARLQSVREAHPDAWLIEQESLAIVTPSSRLDTDRAIDPVTLPPTEQAMQSIAPERREDDGLPRRDHEDDKAPRGYGIHELRRSEDRTRGADERSTDRVE